MFFEDVKVGNFYNSCYPLTIIESDKEGEIQNLSKEENKYFFILEKNIVKEQTIKLRLKLLTIKGKIGYLTWHKSNNDKKLEICLVEASS